MVLSTFIRQYNLYLQILFLVVVFISVGLQKQKKFRLHGIIMIAAVVLHLISVITIMLPSYMNLLIAEGALDTVYITVLIHGIIGILTTALAVWIVASWRLRQSLKYCTPKKNAMRATLTLWVLTVILAILLYVV